MDELSIGNSELIAQVNRTLVLQAIRRLQPTFRAEVSRWTNLNPATVTAIVAELLTTKVLKEIPGEPKPSSPTGGRPPLMLKLNNSARRVLAIDLEPDVLRVAVLGLNLEIEEYREQLIDRHSTPERVIEQIVKLCQEVNSHGRRRTWDGIGLSLPGLIDRERGVLIASTNMPKWREVPLQDILAKQLGQTPQVERACHLAAMHEDWIDNESLTNTKLVISLRTGIGMSLVRQGELYLGAGGFDGEIGHTVIDLQGEQCECGNRGCLETFVRADAVRQRVEQQLRAGRCLAVQAAVAQGETLRPELIYQLAQSGDADCAEIVLDVGRYVGLAAANLVNVLAPNVLILCGSIDRADDLILQAVREQIEQRALPQIRHQLAIRLAQAQEKSALLGAAVLVLRDMFDLPKLLRSQRAMPFGLRSGSQALNSQTFSLDKSGSQSHH